MTLRTRASRQTASVNRASAHSCLGLHHPGLARMLCCPDALPPDSPPTRKFFLTNFIVRWKDVVMIDVAVIDNAAAAEAALEPARARLLAGLTEPQSGATRAGAVGLARQKVNYHLRMVAQHVVGE